MLVKTQLMSGAGNLFSVIDNRNLILNDDFVKNYHKVLSEKLGENSITTEGIMLLQNSNGPYDFECLFFNPDGTSGMMCGNGGRCILQFAKDIMFADMEKTDFTFLMANNQYSGRVFQSNWVKLSLPTHKVIEKRVLDLDIVEGTEHIKNSYQFVYVNNGSDHSVFDFSNLTEQEFWDFDLKKFAKLFRFHPSFPNGTNVNIFTTSNLNNTILLRTFERGVESETGSCGTGAIATTISAFLSDKTLLPAKIVTSSKSNLEVDILYNKKSINSKEFFSKDLTYTLTGSAEYLAEVFIEV